MNTQQTPQNRSRTMEVLGILAILLGIFLSVCLLSYNQWDPSLFTYTKTAPSNYGGIAGAYIADIFYSLIGAASLAIPIVLLGYGVRRILGRQRNRIRLAGVLVFLLALAFLLELIGERIAFPISHAGGAAGTLIIRPLERLVSPVGAYLVTFAVMLIGIVLASPVSPFDQLFRKRVPKTPVTPSKTAYEGNEVHDDEEQHRPEPLLTRLRRQRERKTPEQQPLPPLPAADLGDYELPRLDFLMPADTISGPSREEMNASGNSLEKKLADFGTNGKIRQAHPGPIVTMFEFEPAAGVKINRIVSLSDDLALSLRAPSIRVYPIPGKATIGIEVPNRERATVALRDIIASEQFQKSPSLLTLALGKDIFGNPVVTDLARMPHLLVAGATGSGKSVSVNTMIASMLYKASPQQVRMLMIDPKLLELSVYGDIPHLISPVITDPKGASEALKKMVFEMERRYRVLAEKGARNIDTFNRQVSPEERLPYIVVFIDELADLMFTAPADVETAIARLAQMARACGIHLILATQRPSVDVITGLIKANFPARISFQVTTRIDSRTILDSQGAEQLLGMGDMLFMVPGVRLIRIHGAFVSEGEIRKVTDFIKNQGKPDYSTFETMAIVEERMREDAAGGDRDDLFKRVVEFAESAGEVSISSIQRRFKIGYNRAALLMEQLEEDGLVGPPKGAGKPRDFLGRRSPRE
ncbi:MAG TPA: DNA translocase FtsK 4TM domain-containing protein [Dissulfurispiraceae bacterium]|nr:DNA translocase FtsK 4TM domain-containing protein [Dissulfurispiraceae bacterium]